MEQQGTKKSFTERSLDFLEKQPKDLLMGVSLLILIFISILDFLTGLEIIFSFFYLLPVSIAAWYVGRKEGVFLSVASALTWTLANQILREGTIRLLVSYWNAGVHLGFFLIFTLLVSEVRILLERERSLARTDFLTGVLNRRAFYEASKIEISRVKRTNQPFTVVYVDIDAFKAINDTQGHDVGDTVLRTVTETIQDNIRAGDFVGRLGGDEFAIFLPETNQLVAKSIAPRLQRISMERMQDKGYAVTLSIGVLTFLAPPVDVEVMLKLADRMLYRVKNAGKNAIEFAEHTA